MAISLIRWKNDKKNDVALDLRISILNRGTSVVINYRQRSNMRWCYSSQFSDRVVASSK